MKVIFLKKQKLFILICIALILVILAQAFNILDGNENVQATFATGGKIKPIYCVDTQEKKIAISFDAAWGAELTPQILDILDEYNVKATFFLVGFWVEKYPDILKEIYNRGHEIGNHSENHPHMSTLSPAQMKLEIERVNEEIFQCINVTPTVFRAPFGDYNDALMNTVKGLNMKCIQWSVDSLDWKELGCDKLVDTVCKKVKNGSIVLFHNNAKYITQALPIILEKLLQEGYTIVPVSQLIYADNYIVDHAGVQRKNN